MRFLSLAEQLRRHLNRMIFVMTSDARRAIFPLIRIYKSSFILTSLTYEIKLKNCPFLLCMKDVMYHNLDNDVSHA